MNLNRVVTKNLKGLKGLQTKSRGHTVEVYGNWGYRVTSGSSGMYYFVAYSVAAKSFTCTCKWGQLNGGACSHVQAVISYYQEQEDRRSSFWADGESARRQRRPMMVVAEDRNGNRVLETSRKR